MPVMRPVLQGNQLTAERNRAIFRQNKVTVLNLMSSPGAGKTAFLERWVGQAGKRLRIGVIEGDVATTLDAERIARCGAPVVQINTHGACHLDAGMIARALDHFDLAALDCLVIENVGNLVCPAEFDLGETLRITLLSLTEGQDKPAKYPTAFQRSDAVVLTKVDLLPHLPVDLEQLCAQVRQLNPGAPVLRTSAVTGEGFEQWIQWLQGQLKARSGAGSE